MLAIPQQSANTTNYLIFSVILHALILFPLLTADDSNTVSFHLVDYKESLHRSGSPEGSLESNYGGSHNPPGIQTEIQSCNFNGTRTYVGSASGEQETVTIESYGSQVKGFYEGVDAAGRPYSGKFTNLEFVYETTCRLKGTWSDQYGTGPVFFDFSPDFKQFAGGYSSDGKNFLLWTGRLVSSL